MPRVRLDGGLIGVTNNPSSGSAGGMWSFSEHSKFTRSSLWPAASAPVNSINAIALVVAGGGGGGYNFGGGGGAGGTIFNSNLNILNNSNYTITIGAGGTGSSVSVIPTSGTNTTAFGYTAVGGGAGGTTNDSTNTNIIALSGGSGGGARGYVVGTNTAKGTGTAGQGNDGGTSTTNAQTNGNIGGGGGGGGASAIGTSATTSQGGNGGAGIYSSISGSNTAYGGGGGGGGYSPLTALAGTGGVGGGGSGNNASNGSGATGTAYTGGGGGGSGGGGGGGSGGNGGSGIVIINYPAPQRYTGGTITNVNNLAGSNIVHTFTTSGSLNALGYSIDTYFPQTTLLLHGDGTNGANNTVFLDSSTNNLTITTNGKPQQGTFSPFSQTGWSTYFNGSSDYFSTPSSTNFNCGTGDFTMEFWTFIPVTPSVNFPSIISSTNWNTGTGGVSIRYSNTGYTNKFSFHWYNVGDPFLVTPGTFAPGNWYHIALTRSGNTFTLWVNGVSQATGTNSGTVDWNLSSAGMKIGGGNWDAAAGYIQMYLSNLRLVKGTAVYTSTFIPSLTPLTAIANTQFLAFQNNYFYASNTTSSVTLTPSSAPQIQPFSPFSPSSAYSNTAIGGSVYFNGSTDYLSLTTNSNIELGAGNWTVECWIYPTSVSIAQNIIFEWRNSNNTKPVLYLVNNVVYWRNNSATQMTGGTLSANTWYHIAVVKNSGTTTLYINGVSVASFADSFTYATDATFQIGKAWDANYFNGYISNARIIKGTAQYTSNFTPSSTPLTAVANTSLLLNATNAGIIDNTGKNNITTYGSAAISSTQSKFGGTSMYFDGSTSVITAPYVSNFHSFHLSDYTVELWVYPLSYAGMSNGASALPTLIGGMLYNNNTNDWSFGMNTSGILKFTYYNGSATQSVTSSTTVPLNTWSHIAAVKTSSGISLYYNGTLAVGPTALSGTPSIQAGTFLTLGAYYNTYCNAYVDDVRISKYARYTSNFTPPTSAFLDR